MREIIQEINASSTFAKIVEIGAGMPVSNKIFRYSGASKTIFSAQSNYAREAFDNEFGSSVQKAVSVQRLELINQKYKEEIERGLYNTILSSSFQVGDYTNNVSTHGWYCLNINNKSKFYHVSIHTPMTREEYIETIGDIGILIMHSRNEVAFNNSYIDIVMDSPSTYDVDTTLKFMSLSDTIAEHASIFKADRTIDRLESLTRDANKIALYRGSFNPPSVAHLEIAETYEQTEKVKPTFTISIDTYEKGTVELSSLKKRIEMINMLGYDVLILTRKLFKTNVDFLRYKYTGEIVFPLGLDTFSRVLDYYEISSVEQYNELMISKFKDVRFFLVGRDNCSNAVIDELLSNNIVEYFKIKNSHVSSTDIRNGAVEYLPSGLFDIYVK